MGNFDMKHTERIERINAGLNRHFKSNRDAWWVNNEGCTRSDIVTLHRGHGGDRIDPRWVALYILRTEPSVKTVHYAMACTIYTRESLRWAGYKI